MNTEDELRIALLAFRRGLIDSRQFVELSASWLEHPGSTLVGLLTGKGWISDSDRVELESRVSNLTTQREDAEASSSKYAETEISSKPDPFDPNATTELCASGREATTLAAPSDRSAGSTRQDGCSLAWKAPGDGRYERIRLHATGGIGQVWQARDRRLGREVALKELRPDRLENSRIVARFLEEARINGQLQHPNIVPVYDLIEGTSGDFPGYTMRFISGRTLSEAVDEFHRQPKTAKGKVLALRELLNAFVAVCNAVAFAHSRDVLHRDLKGQNVLLGDFGEVLLLDWGLAKVVGGDEAESVEPVQLDPDQAHEETQAGQVLGTPSYMAPEQALAGKVDRRSDIYGLGAILYKILTGLAPYTGSKSQELLRRLREEPPLRPREVLSTVDPALEAVCLKAMAREPSERYGTATELADEIRHWLADEPVKAHPEPWTDRVRRWSRRHQTLVVSGAVLLVTGVVSLGLSNWRIRQEQRQTEQARITAVTNFNLARSAVQETLVAIARGNLPDLPGTEELRRTVTQRVRYIYGEFLKSAPDDPYIQSDAAGAFMTAGTVLRQTNRFEEARQSLDRAMDLLDGLVHQDPENPSYRDRLAEALIEQVVTLRLEGHLADGEPHLRRALDVVKTVRTRFPDFADARRTEARALYMLSRLARETGRGDEAVRTAEESVKIVDSLPHLPQWRDTEAMEQIFAVSHLGPAYRANRRWAEARAAAQRLLKLAEDYHSGEPSNNNRRFLLADAHLELARCLLGDPADRAAAATHFDQAIRLIEPLTHEFERLPNYRRALAEARIERGTLRADLGQTDLARNDAEAARDVLTKLLANDPNHPTYEALMGRCLGLLGRLAIERGDPEEARKPLDQAIDQTRRALEANPRSPENQELLRRLQVDRRQATNGNARPD